MSSFFNPILDGSDLKGISHPKNIKHIRYMQFWLGLVGAWPARALGERATAAAVVFTHYNFYLPVFLGTLMVSFVGTHINVWSFFEMGKPYIGTFMCVVYIARQVIPLTAKYEKLVAQFFNVIHLFHHRHSSDYAMKMHLFVHKVSSIFTILTIGMMLWGYTLFSTIPLYNNWAGGGYSAHMPANFSYDYSVDYALPFDYERDLRIHIPVTLLTIYNALTCSISFCVNDLFLSIQMFHLWGHLKILIHSLENFPRPAHPASVNYSAEELPDVSRRLRDIVVHHNLILRNVEDISSTFGPAIAVYYMYHQVGNCILLLEISTLETKALIRYGPLTLIILQLQIQISAVFELLSSMTDQLILAAYSLPWELMDVSNRRSALVILRQSQRPLKLKAMGMVEAGMATTVSILKTTMSYFIMLKTIAME